MYENLLKQAGLTGSETKIYLSLLKNGTMTKTPLVKHSKVAGSKIYEIIDKLLDKGLVSVSVINNIKHFTAANPKKIKSYMKKKREEINLAEKKIDNIIPQLLGIRNQKEEQPEISIYYGWEGLATVFEEELDKCKSRSKVYVIGASSGETKQAEIFYTKYARIALDKKLDINIIFNIDSKKYAQETKKKLGIKYNKRFLMNKSPTEVTIIGDICFITILNKSPTIIKIGNKETAETFKQYFQELWKVAKK